MAIAASVPSAGTTVASTAATEAFIKATELSIGVVLPTSRAVAGTTGVVVGTTGVVAATSEAKTVSNAQFRDRFALKVVASSNRAKRPGVRQDDGALGTGGG